MASEDESEQLYRIVVERRKRMKAIQQLFPEKTQVSGFLVDSSSLREWAIGRIQDNLTELANRLTRIALEKATKVLNNTLAITKRLAEQPTNVEELVKSVMFL
jgi:hypothetical protein